MKEKIKELAAQAERVEIFNQDKTILDFGKKISPDGSQVKIEASKNHPIKVVIDGSETTYQDFNDLKNIKNILDIQSSNWGTHKKLFDYISLDELLPITTKYNYLLHYKQFDGERLNFWWVLEDHSGKHRLIVIRKVVDDKFSDNVFFVYGTKNNKSFSCNAEREAFFIEKLRQHKNELSFDNLQILSKEETLLLIERENEKEGF